MKEGEHMTKEQKLEAYSMRLDGATFQEIADRFGISKQRVQSLFPGRVSLRTKYSGYIYPNIVKYLREKNKTLSELASDCGMATSGLRGFLVGESGGTKNTVDAILHVTGMKYEEAFYTRPLNGPSE